MIKNIPLKPCRECDHKTSILIKEGLQSRRIHMICPKVVVKRITEHGETYFAGMREVKNTGINPDWCPLRK